MYIYLASSLSVSRFTEGCLVFIFDIKGIIVAEMSEQMSVVKSLMSCIVIILHLYTTFLLINNIVAKGRDLTNEVRMSYPMKLIRKTTIALQMAE